MLTSTVFARLLLAFSLALAVVGTTALATAAAPAERPAAIDAAFQDDDGGGNGTSGVGQLPATGSGPLDTDSHAGELFAAIVAATIALAAGGVWRWRVRTAR